ncbi:MAG: hypothetical protein C3F07_01005 [Anaerolineales bacterium]|nr:hypothetical protein [Anaerolineae bacterium]PWB77921.1 MAG: hypothetical protein C3F07_01005 [Anaerolineales bacterium]
MKPQLIVIDGKTYNSVDEMPPEVRQKYEQAMNGLKDGNMNRVPDAFENMNILGDKDNDGVPDAFEDLPGASVMTSSMKFVVDGREYNRIEDLPPDARAKYEKAMGALDKNRNGMPDFLEGMLDMPGQIPHARSAAEATSPRPASPKPVTASPTITPDTSNGWMLALTGLFLLVLCAAGAAGIWYFFLR